MVRKNYKRLYANANKAIEHFSTWMLIGLFIAVLLQVFFRYVLNSPLTWTEEAARYLNIWIVLFGTAVAVCERDNLRVDLVDIAVKKWPYKAQVIFYFVTTLLCLLVVISFIKGGYETTKDQWTISMNVLPFPQGLLFLGMLIAASFMFWFFLHQLIEHLKALIKRDAGGIVK
ncbi:TRAP transporter small permease [Alteribacillus bidgolensis]|uniref:TRAP-type C4-dicarboxylate transport system, small permease component n=1 Tax=Alteribacillus bidgolensis TaxID=930129 RepID=A0A1G8I959_9BACI|nr:TRAP transporter small permease [Alteribacillus bidgolensis]SDI15291.1 TRAP-type C4-dicarboxylate transport system, small permease component [Alteribacillus bidgolensis]